MYSCKIVSYKVHLSISDLYNLSVSDKCNYIVVNFKYSCVRLRVSSWPVLFCYYWSVLLVQWLLGPIVKSGGIWSYIWVKV